MNIAALIDARSIHGHARKPPGSDVTYTEHSDFSREAGVANLGTSITCNGSTVNASDGNGYLYYGGDAAASLWTPGSGGGNLTKQSGTPVLNTSAPGTGANDDSVDLNGAFYKDVTSGGTVGDIATEDFVFEAILKYNTVSQAVVGKRLASPLQGYMLYPIAGNVLRFYLYDGGTTVYCAGTLPAGQWAHVLVCGDRDQSTAADSMQIYVNGTAGTAVAINTCPDCTTTTPFEIGAVAGAATSDAWVAYAALFLKASWFAGASNSEDWAALAWERACYWAGAIATSTDATTTSPVSARTGRTTAAYLDQLESGVVKYYYMAAGLPRVVYRADDASTEIKGYLIEPARTNKFLYSTDITDASWAKTLCGAGGTPAASPDADTNLEGVIVQSGAKTAGVTKDVTLTAATYTISGLVKAGDKSHCALIAEDGTGWNYCWFNLSTGAEGTREAKFASSKIISLGGGIYRVEGRFTGEASARAMGITPTDGDNDTDCTGDNSTTNIYAGFMQLELGEYASSPIPTTSGEVTRVKDDIEFKADDGALDGATGDNAAGRLTCNVLLPDYDVATATSLLSISDGGSAADAITLECETDDYIDANSAKTAGDAGNSTYADDLADDTVHALQLDWEEDSFLTAVDSNDGNEDTACDPPVNLDRITFGASVGQAAQFGGIIGQIKFYTGS